MKGKAISGIMLTMLLISMLTLSFHIQPVKAEPKTIYVDDDNATGPWDGTPEHPYQNITSGLEHASAGNTIYVYNGTYHENVVIDKTLCLIGENRTATIIDGYGAQWTVRVNANNVTILGFTIRNGGKGLKSPIIPNGGIKLISNSSKVSNNIATGNGYIGIWLGYYAISNGNIIENNSVHNNFYGIHLGGSSFNNLTKNSVINNYIGMQVSGSNNVLRENSIKNNTYNFGASGIQDIDTSNTIDGKPIYYLVGQRNKRVPSIAGYVAAINCVNITVDDVSLRALLTGIQFVNTTESTVRRATILNSSFSDFYLLNSHNNTIRNSMFWSHTGRYTDILALRDSNHNTIINNTIRGGNVIVSGDPYGTGIDLYNSSFNRIVGNTIVNNWNAIFLTYSNYNRIYHNDFINNKINVPIGAIKEENTWDDGYPSGGNYWSDYTGVDLFSGPYQNETGSDGIVDTPYVIDENNQDNYPLMEPWSPKTLLGRGWGWMRIAHKEYVYGKAELYKIRDEQIELIITHEGQQYSRTWKIIFHKEYKHGEIYLCYSNEWGFLIVGLHKHERWQFWYAVGKGVVAFGFQRYGRTRLMPI